MSESLTTQKNQVLTDDLVVRVRCSSEHRSQGPLGCEILTPVTDSVICGHESRSTLSQTGPWVR